MEKSCFLCNLVLFTCGALTGQETIWILSFKQDPSKYIGLFLVYFVCKNYPVEILWTMTMYMASILYHSLRNTNVYYLSSYP